MLECVTVLVVKEITPFCEAENDANESATTSGDLAIMSTDKRAKILPISQE